MANGDAAAAAGLTTTPGTADRRLGYDAINYALDRIVTRVFGTAQIADDAVTTAKIAASAVTDAKIAAVAASKLTGTITRPINTASGSGIIANGADINANGGNLLGSGLTTTGDAHIGGTTNAVTVSASGPVYSPHGRANGVSGGLTAYLGADGRLAVSSSSRRFKRDIVLAELTFEQFETVQAFWYRYIDLVDELGDAAETELFIMAEDAHDAGLTWLVVYDNEGRPSGINERRFLAAIYTLTMQAHHETAALRAELVARIAALEARS